MISNFRPLFKHEKMKNLREYRSIFIEEVTNGKKKKWKELTLKEKIIVDAKCRLLDSAILW